MSGALMPNSPTDRAPHRSATVTATVAMDNGRLLIELDPGLAGDMPREPVDVTARPIHPADPVAGPALDGMDSPGWAVQWIVPFHRVHPGTPRAAVLAEHHRRVLAYCQRHPWLAWLRGWTR